VVKTHGPPALMALLEVQNVFRDFGGVHAVDGVSFDVQQGSITGLIGPNGAGKSTAVSIIAGSVRPTGGSILFDGHDITAEVAHRRARRGLIRTFQMSSEFSKLTVLENLLVGVQRQRGATLPGALLGKGHWREEERASVLRARELLDRFGMADHESAYAGNLSGGQRRLVEIMRTLMAEPKLLLLDEPAAGIHPRLVRRIVRYLEELRAEGLTMLLIEHELSLVERLCDPVIVMAQGKVIAEGPMREIRSHEHVVAAYLAG
jgi:branched-chain amino acid transport system ATP-binding protein